MLAEVYRPWFDALLDAVPPHGRALEIGAGPGFFRERATVRRPDIRLTSLDVLTTPWNDLVGDALRLPLRSSTFDAIVGTDVLHHLARPAAFFAEGARVLRPGGSLAFIEPWVSSFSYPIYRFLHQEGCTLGLDPWRPFGDAVDKAAFDGDAAVVPGLVRRTPAERWRELGLGPPQTRLLNGFAYLLSLGFKPVSLLPKSLAPAVMAMDRILGGAAPLVALRVFVVWRKG